MSCDEPQSVVPPRRAMLTRAGGGCNVWVKVRCAVDPHNKREAAKRAAGTSDFDRAAWWRSFWEWHGRRNLGKSARTMLENDPAVIIWRAFLPPGKPCRRQGLVGDWIAADGFRFMGACRGIVDRWSMYLRVSARECHFGLWVHRMMLRRPGCYSMAWHDAAWQFLGVYGMI